MKQIQLSVLILMFCGMGFSAAHPTQVIRKTKKRKSLTTAQLYKKGPFLGGQSVASLPSTLSAQF
jgi:hypothetical protein